MNNDNGFSASVADEAMGKIDEIAEQLCRLGCTDVKVLKIIGIITGQAPKGTHFNDLKVNGIESIEPDSPKHSC